MVTAPWLWKVEQLWYYNATHFGKTLGLQRGRILGQINVCGWHSGDAAKSKCNGKNAVDHNCQWWNCWSVFPLKCCRVSPTAGFQHLQLFLQEGFSLNFRITSSSSQCPIPPPPPPPLLSPPFSPLFIPLPLLRTNLGWWGDGYLNAKWCCNSTHRGGVND